MKCDDVKSKTVSLRDVSEKSVSSELFLNHNGIIQHRSIIVKVEMLQLKLRRNPSDG